MSLVAVMHSGCRKRLGLYPLARQPWSSMASPWAQLMVMQLE